MYKMACLLDNPRGHPPEDPYLIILSVSASNISPNVEFRCLIHASHVFGHAWFQNQTRLHRHQSSRSHD